MWAFASYLEPLVFFSFRTWRLRHLLMGWLAYWVALFAITLGPAVVAAIAAKRGPDDGTSTIAVNISSATGWEGIIVSRGERLWSGSATIAEIVAWVTLPPLLMWGVWVWGVRHQARRPVAPPAELRDGASDAAPMRPRDADLHVRDDQ